MNLGGVVHILILPIRSACDCRPWAAVTLRQLFVYVNTEKYKKCSVPLTRVLAYNCMLSFLLVVELEAMVMAVTDKGSPLGTSLAPKKEKNLFLARHGGMHLDLKHSGVRGRRIIQS